MKTWKKVVLGSVSLLAAGTLLTACSSNSSKESSSS